MASENPNIGGRVGWRYLPLAQALATLQEANGLSDRAFAKQIGVDFTYWWRVRHGKRAPGAALRRALLAYPELGELVVRLEAG
jgi:transcriptional regulator with XRE-family HTH domain